MLENRPLLLVRWLAVLCVLALAPHAQLRAERLLASVRIEDGVASTTLQTTWRNDSGVVQEARWLLPLPEGALADDFRMKAQELEAIADSFEGENAMAAGAALAARAQTIAVLGQQLAQEVARISTDANLREPFSEAIAAFSESNR